MKDWYRSPEPPSMMGPAVHRSAAERPSDAWPSSPTSPHYHHTTTTTSMATTSSSPPHNHSIRPRTKVDVSLAEMARRCIVQKIHLFDTFGSTPFSIVRPILEQCPAKKLLALEEASPHLLQGTGYIWKRLCIKDFKDIAQACQSGTLPESTDWRALHIKRQSAQQEAIGAAAARVKEKYASLEANRVANRVRVVAPTSPIAMRANRIGAGRPKSAILTSGQKLLRDARKQGSVRSQMTQGIRKTAPPPLPSPPIEPPVTKRPRLEVDTRSPTTVKSLGPRQSGILITRIPGTARRH